MQYVFLQYKTICYKAIFLIIFRDYFEAMTFVLVHSWGCHHHRRAYVDIEWATDKN